MTPAGLRAALAAWAAEFDCAPQLLTAAHTAVVRHGPAFGSERVAFALATPSACIITVPND